MCDEIKYEADTSYLTNAFLRELIREQAYRLFERRGQRPGHELEDWLEAEREIKRHFGLE